MISFAANVLLPAATHRSRRRQPSKDGKPRREVLPPPNSVEVATSAQSAPRPCIRPKHSLSRRRCSTLHASSVLCVRRSLTLQKRHLLKMISFAANVLLPAATHRSRRRQPSKDGRPRPVVKEVPPSSAVVATSAISAPRRCTPQRPFPSRNWPITLHASSAKSATGK